MADDELEIEVEGSEDTGEEINDEVENKEVETEEDSKEEDKELEDKEEDTDDEDDDEEDKEDDKEDEEEVEEPKEKVASKYHRPIFSEIKKTFPEFFKKFPEFREIYFREGQFSKIFPTAEEAEEALNKSSNFEIIAEDLAKGSTNKFLELIAPAGKALTRQIAENFLPTLYEKDKEAYYAAANPIVETFISNIYHEGKRLGGDVGENLIAVAEHAAKFLTGDPDASKLGHKREVDPKIAAQQKQLEDDRKALDETSFRNTFSEVSERCTKSIVTEVAKGIIIENKALRETAIQKSFELINKTLSQDERHIKLMNSLWNKARKESFSPESKRALVSTLLGRAKQIIPAINREIMTQLNPKSDQAKKNKKSILGGKVKESTNKTSPVNGDIEKVDWGKYGNSKVNFINDFIDNKGKVAKAK